MNRCASPLNMKTLTPTLSLWARVRESAETGSRSLSADGLIFGRMTRRKGTGWIPSFFAALFLLPALIAGPADAAVARRAARKPVVQAKPTYAAALLMESSTGRILFERESRKPWPPASLTKMMLMLVVMEKAKQKAISLSDRVEISARVGDRKSVV